MKNRFGLVVTLVTGLAGCGSDDPTAPTPDPVTFSFNFNTGDHAWIADFVDFPPDREEEVGFVSDRRFLPAPLDESQQALFHRGLNLSDDLFMYYKRPVTGLEAGARYRVTFLAGYATPIGSECTVGLNLYLKAGAVMEEPVRVIGTADGSYRLSADKGGQNDAGSEALLLGEIHNTNPGCNPEFGLGTLGDGVGPLTVTADDTGSIWLYFGEESVFEGPHELYYTFFEAVFERF
ncbi:hypothetical protein ACFL0I_03185 [Gemmatimonadota bacterium]